MSKTVLRAYKYRLYPSEAEWYGRKVVVIDTYFPSSQICSGCGFRNQKVKDLNIRKWTCPNCSAEHDRDVNAAINILNEGLKLLQKVA